MYLTASLCGYMLITVEVVGHLFSQMTELVMVMLFTSFGPPERHKAPSSLNNFELSSKQL